MKEGLVIVSDGKSARVFLSGKEVDGIRNITFRCGLDTCPTIDLELLVLPNSIKVK
jgi:hypothetical protein